MVSLPIPSSLDRLAYLDIKWAEEWTYARILDELDAGARINGSGAHLDPDLLPGSRPRKSGWRPSLGQIGAAAGHLRNQGVGVGDLLLFYGWFRHAHIEEGQLQFISGNSGFHAIFGYLEIGEVIRSKTDSIPDWLTDHPHALATRMMSSTNTIFVASDRLTYFPNLQGAGIFKFNPSLVLSQPGPQRSRWALDPSIFRGIPISYHTDAAWRDGYFQSYPRGQEYVVEGTGPVIQWAHRLIQYSQLSVP